MTVYPDLAFLIGALVHGAVSVLVLRLLDLHGRGLWMAVYIMLSGGCSALCLIPAVPTVVPALIGIGSFFFFLRGKHLRGTIRNGLTGLLVFILFLGCMVLLAGVLFSLRIVFASPGGYFILSFWDTVLSAVLTFAVGWFLVETRRKRSVQANCCECSVVVCGKTVPVRCFVDSGNFLRDPLSGLPVAIVEYGALKRVFGSEFPLPMTYEFSAFFGVRARVIPYRSVSGDGQMLSAFLPDGFTVNGISQRAIVAVSPVPLEDQGRFSGIVGLELMKGV